MSALRWTLSRAGILILGLFGMPLILAAASVGGCYIVGYVLYRLIREAR